MSMTMRCRSTSNLSTLRRLRGARYRLLGGLCLASALLAAGCGGGSSSQRGDEPARPTFRLEVVAELPSAATPAPQTGGSLDGSDIGALALLPDGALLAGDVGARRILRIAPGGGVTTIVDANGRKAGERDGSGEAPLATPADLLPQPDGTILVADHWAGCIRRILPGASEAVLVGYRGRCVSVGGALEEGPMVPTDGPFQTAVMNSPAGLSESPFGILVADSWMLRLLTAENQVITLYSGQGFPGSLPWFTSVAWDETRNVGYATSVVGTPFPLVRILPTDAGLRVEPLATKGEPIRWASDVAVCPSGRVFVAATMADALYELDPEAGELRLAFGVPRSGPNPDPSTPLPQPRGLTCAPDGSLYLVTGFGANRIVRLVPE